MPLVPHGYVLYAFWVLHILHVSYPAVDLHQWTIRLPLSLSKPVSRQRNKDDLRIHEIFEEFPHLPKMLRQRDIGETLALGCEQGYFVLRLPRPDKTFRTLWRAQPTDADLKDRDLEIVLPEAAELTELDSRLLGPLAIPGLWPTDGSPLTVGAVQEFFDGQHASKVQREG